MQSLVQLPSGRHSSAATLASRAFVDYYRCPESFARFTVKGDGAEKTSSFHFGEDALCYGPRWIGSGGETTASGPYDALGDVTIDRGSLCLPFDPTAIVENLRRERYLGGSQNGRTKRLLQQSVSAGYRFVRPALPVPLRKHLQRLYLRGWEDLAFPTWPVDRTVDSILEQLLILTLKATAIDRIPFIWFWPHGAPSCAVMTHDVETVAGRDFCSRLMDLDDSFGIKSSFQLVPERRYAVAPGFLDSIRARGFEINVHDLNHDGRLFSNRECFAQRAERINHWGREFGALGFRSGSLYRNPDWFELLDFAYDMSMPNVGHLEAQRGGCCTVMPFFIGDILELPLTATQDYSLFHILTDYSIDLWKRQIALITAKHGLVSFIVHPDYVTSRRARATYEELLAHLAQLRGDRSLWTTLPREVNRWWRERSQMKIVGNGKGWHIEGEGAARARLAFATLIDDKLAFTIETQK